MPMRHPSDRGLGGQNAKSEKGARGEPPRHASADPGPPNARALAQLVVIHKRGRRECGGMAWIWAGWGAQAFAAAFRARAASTRSIAFCTAASIERKLVSSVAASAAAISGAVLRVESRWSRARMSAST